METKLYSYLETNVVGCFFFSEVNVRVKCFTNVLLLWYELAVGNASNHVCNFMEELFLFHWKNL